MKINDIYNFESVKTSTVNDEYGLHAKSQIFMELFGLVIHELDEDSMRKDSDLKKFSIDTKLSFIVDYRRSVSYTAYKYGDTYFALSITSGREEDDNTRLYVTDESTLYKVRDLFNKHIERHTHLDIVNPEQDMDNLDMEYGLIIHKDDSTGKVELVKPNSLNKSVEM